MTWAYTYDADGMRTGRTDGTNIYEYIYAGDKLVRKMYNGQVVDFTYAGNQPLTMTYDGATYYYILKGQGDVIGLTDDTGKMVICYHYGAYGVGMSLAADKELAPVLIKVNPFLYCAYVYDREESALQHDSPTKSQDFVGECSFSIYFDKILHLSPHISAKLTVS